MYFKQCIGIFVLMFLIGLFNWSYSNETQQYGILENANISFSQIYDVYVTENKMFAATDQGIYESQDQGVSWQALPSAQLPTRSIIKIIYSQPYGLIAASSMDVYQFVNGHWQHIHKGTQVNPIKDLDMNTNGEVIATTERGIISLSLLREGEEGSSEILVEMSYDELRIYFAEEPSIQDVQAWAIDYAEVHPEKIQKWRQEAKRKAWFPSLDIGVDANRDWSFNDSIWGTSSGNHYIGPDDKSFGKDIGFDVSFSWDLSDLVWSTDQTSIDNRSKLMAELREDILDQVTRLYFERRRLQIDLLTKKVTKDLSLQHHLRIDELTALVDGFTDTQFSRSVTRKSVLKYEMKL